MSRSRINSTCIYCDRVAQHRVGVGGSPLCRGHYARWYRGLRGEKLMGPLRPRGDGPRTRTLAEVYERLMALGEVNAALIVKNIK